jgi:hypothetical protein
MLKKPQKRRLEALRESQKLVAGGPGILFGTTPAKLERKIDDVIDFAEFILDGDRTFRSRDGSRLIRYSPGYDEDINLDDDAA